MTIEELRERRESLGLTQDELSRRIGVQLTTLSRWETGRVEPHIVWMRAWEQALIEAEEEAA